MIELSGPYSKPTPNVRKPADAFTAEYRHFQALVTYLWVISGLGGLVGDRRG